MLYHLDSGSILSSVHKNTFVLDFWSYFWCRQFFGHCKSEWSPWWWKTEKWSACWFRYFKEGCAGFSGFFKNNRLQRADILCVTVSAPKHLFWTIRGPLWSTMSKKLKTPLKMGGKKNCEQNYKLIKNPDVTACLGKPFLAAPSSSKSLVVRPLVGWSVGRLCEKRP